MVRLYALYILLALSLPLPVVGCTTPEKTYIEADRKTYTAIADEYLQYVVRDPTLPMAAAEARRDVIFSWRRRIEEAEQK